jgi:hypothetical protein
MSLAHDLFFQRTFWFVAGLLTVDAAAVRSTACTPAVADSRGSS